MTPALWAVLLGACSLVAGFQVSMQWAASARPAAADDELDGMLEMKRLWNEKDEGEAEALECIIGLMDLGKIGEARRLANKLVDAIRSHKGA